MRRLDRVLSRVAERGDPLGADLLIDRLEAKLAGEPDPIVVARKGSDIMQTYEKRTTKQPSPPTRRRGVAVAVAAFIGVLVVGGGIALWAALEDDGGTEPAAQATTQAPSAPTGEVVGTFSFDGTTWSYDGPSTVEAGSVTFSLVNTSSEEAAVFSWFGLDEDEIEDQLGDYPVGAEIGPLVGAGDAPPGGLLWLVEAAPGESVSATHVMGEGAHMIDASTLRAGGTDYLWRVAVIEAIEPESLPTGEVVGTFSFDGATWSYDGPSTVEAGSVTFSLVNTSSEEAAVFSWFGLSDDEIEDQLAATPVGTDIGDASVAPPAPPGNFLWLVEAAPGESVSATHVMGAGPHMIDAATLKGGGTDYLWRVAVIEAIEP